MYVWHDMVYGMGSVSRFPSRSIKFKTDTENPECICTETLIYQHIVVIIHRFTGNDDLLYVGEGQKVLRKRKKEKMQKKKTKQDIHSHIL